MATLHGGIFFRTAANFPLGLAQVDTNIVSTNFGPDDLEPQLSDEEESKDDSDVDSVDDPPADASAQPASPASGNCARRFAEAEW